MGSDCWNPLRLRIRDISIHAPRVGSDLGQAAILGGNIISIHAPRVGSDFASLSKRCAPENFNPRSPCGERLEFPSWLIRPPLDFNPRSPCGERPVEARQVSLTYDFNPRSPCGERLDPPHCARHAVRFQSTLPVWGATRLGLHLRLLVRRISIHAPRVGSDFSFPTA